jgi:aspartyl aminopeptidase
MEPKNAWLNYSKEDLENVEALSARYRAFLDAGKTERECAALLFDQARARGFQTLEDAVQSGSPLRPGDRLMTKCMGKSLLLFVIGKKPLEEGMNLLGAHIDSPRLDVKQNPLFEDDGLCCLDTHYYGGIKKYQWLSMPLALHGVVIKTDGSKVHISIGEADSDPVLGISDLLAHLSKDQLDKKAGALIEGESMDVIVGSIPLPGDEKQPIKAQILKLLSEKYGIEEKDFLSAELELVPAGRARDFGLDGSMIMAYGHDDRSCAFAAFEALMGFTGVPCRTLCTILTDKEEIGSVGATGMRARYFENAVAELVQLQGGKEISVRRALSNSRMLSCDVSAAFDPKFPEAFEKKNAAYLGRGISLNKYTGTRGKYDTNDANAEFVAKVLGIFEQHNVCYQTAELGKVDQGGGGTIAYMCALYGMEVMDAGLAVLSMHAPWEIVSKADLYESLRALKAFLERA